MSNIPLTDLRELRIGNLLHHPEIGVITITAFTIYRIERRLKQNNPLSYSSIPISEEWLERFGYNGTEGIFVHERRVPYYIELFNGAFVLKNGNGSFAKPVAHIHMLQNIWYFLTGTELTLKP